MSTVLYEQKGKIVTITINRPEAMNSVDPETQQSLIDAWIRFRDDDRAWVAILTGAGDKAFSAGADLKKLIPAMFAKGRTGMHNTYGLGGITRGLEIWKPMIAAINGHCLAGGLEQAPAWWRRCRDRGGRSRTRSPARRFPVDRSEHRVVRGLHQRFEAVHAHRSAALVVVPAEVSELPRAPRSAAVRFAVAWVPGRPRRSA